MYMVSSNIAEVGQEGNKWQKEIFRIDHQIALILYDEQKGICFIHNCKNAATVLHRVGHTDVTKVDQSFYHKYLVEI